MQYSSSMAGLTSELAELLLNHMSREMVLRPRTLELFFGCPLQKIVLNSYPYSTNELLRQLRAFPALKHLSLVNSPLITGTVQLSVLFQLSSMFVIFFNFFFLFRLRSVHPVQPCQTPVPKPGLLQQTDRCLPAAHHRSDLLFVNQAQTNSTLRNTAPVVTMTRRNALNTT